MGTRDLARTRSPLELGQTKLETTKYLNVTTQYLHELNERVPLDDSSSTRLAIVSLDSGGEHVELSLYLPHPLHLDI